jgi:hypothetical protein
MSVTVQQDAIMYSLLYLHSYTVYLYLETALHISGGNSTHYQEHI